MSEFAGKKLEDYVIPQLPTEDERVAAKKAADEAPKPTFSDSVKAAVELDSPGWTFGRWLESSHYQADPNFTFSGLDEEDRARLLDGLPLNMADELKDAVSLPHAYDMKKNLMRKVEAHDVLARAGLNGAAARMGVSIADPVTLAATVASDGVAAPWIYAPRIGKAGAALRGGLAAGVANGAVEAVAMTQDPYRDVSDLLFSASAGFVLGAPLAGLAHTPKAVEAARMIRNEIAARADGKAPSHISITNEHGEELVAAPGSRSINEGVSGEFPGRPAQEINTADTNLGFNSIEELNAAHAGLEKSIAEKQAELTSAKRSLAASRSNIGRIKDEAKRAAAEERIGQLSERIDTLTGEIEGHKEQFGAISELKSRVDYDPSPKASNERYDAIEAMLPKDEQGNIGKAWGNQARGSMFSKLASSEHAMVNWITRRLMPDGVGVDALGKGQGITAWEVTERESRSALSEYYKAADSAFRDFYEANGGNWMNKSKLRNEFEELVGKAVRREPGAFTNDVSINSAADALRGVNKRMLDLAREHGVKGFDEVADNPSYLTRLYNIPKMLDYQAKLRPGEIIRLLSGSIQSGSGMAEKSADKLATAMYKTITRSQYKSPDVIRNLQFSHGKAEYLKEMLNEAFPNESHDAIIDDIMKVIGDNKKQEGVHSRAKRRTLLDEGYGTKLFTKSGGTEDVSIEDILINHAGHIASTYTRQMAGQAGLASVGFKSAADWNRFIGDIGATWERTGLTRADYDATVRKLEILYKATAGIPLSEHTKTSEVLRLMRDYNYARVMNQTGFAQIAEFGNSLGEHGVSTFIESIPAFKGIWMRAKNGEFSDQFAAELDHIWAFGNEPMLNRVDAPYYRDTVEPDSSKFGKMLKKAGHITSTISGMDAITSGLERMTAIMVVKNFADAAAGGEIRYGAKRLAAMGIEDEDMLNRILGQMAANLQTSDGPVSGRKIQSLGLAGWEDDEARAVFINAVHRTVNRTIQKNNPGDLMEWMTTDLGKTMMQFRSFAFVAAEKQLMRGLAMGDAQTFSAWSMSMVFGSLAYMAQTHVQSVGRQDKEQFLQERLSPEQIAKSGFMRAGFASLAPGAIDSVLGFASFDPFFTHGRTTGQSTNLLGGIPVVDLATKVTKGVQGVASSAVNPDYSFSQADVRNLTGGLLFSNAVPFQMVLNSFLGNSGLPLTPHQ